MRNNCKRGRPPVPDTWGSENVSPTRSFELIDVKESIIMNSVTLDTDPVDQTVIPGPSVGSDSLSPTEEYLQLTKRHIDSKLLSHKSTMILQDLYIKYKSANDPFIKDTFVDSKSSMGLLSKETDKKIIKLSSTAKENSMEPHKPSTSEKHEDLKYVSEFREPEEDSRDQILKLSITNDSKAKMFDEEAEQREIPFLNVQDFSFERPCDPEYFKIDTVYSDFSLRDVGHEKMLKKRIRRWIEKETEGCSRNSRIGKQIKVLVEKKYFHEKIQDKDHGT